MVALAILASCGQKNEQQTPTTTEVSTAGFEHYPNPRFAALLHQDLYRAGHNTHCYEFPTTADTPAPDGYEPFYISHYGRHGARSNWGMKHNQQLEALLTEARDSSLLTPEGDSLLQEVKLVLAANDGMDGRLSRKGAEEHKKLGRRMYERYPSVLKQKGKEVRAISSLVPRCTVSMTAFTNEVTSIDPEVNFTWDLGEKFQKYITNDATDEIWRLTHEKVDSLFGEYEPDTTKVIERLFSQGEAAETMVRRHVGSVKNFERMIFSTGTEQDAFNINSSLRHLPFEAVCYWAERENMNLYLSQCNSEEVGMKRVPLAKPLVDDFVTKAEEAIAGNDIAADLRFGHDFPLLGFVSYLGLEGVGDKMSIGEAREKWFGFEQIPFASNVVEVFYRNGEGEVLVKFLYNERETRLRKLEPVSGPYYKWSDVRENIKGYLR